MIAELRLASELALGVFDLQWGRDRMIAELLPRRGKEKPQRILQWGRDRMIAELRGSGAPSGGTGTLQWGRDRMIAEFSPGGYEETQPLMPSMGPRSNDRGITASLLYALNHFILQWGRDRMIAELALTH